MYINVPVATIQSPAHLDRKYIYTEEDSNGVHSWTF